MNTVTARLSRRGGPAAAGAWRLLLIPTGTLGGLIVGLLALEAALWVYPSLDGASTRYLYRRDPLMHHVHRPGVRYTYRSVLGEFATDIRINSKGLYDSEYPYEKRSELRRILIIGDSIPEGIQSPRHENLAKHAEHALDKPDRQVEVLNGAVSGYSPMTEYAFFAHEGLRYKPDIVAAGLVFNDIAGDHQYEAERTGQTDDGLPIWQQPRASSWSAWWNDKMYSYDFLRRRWRRFRIRMGRENPMLEVGKQANFSRGSEAQGAQSNPYALFRETYTTEDWAAVNASFEYLARLEQLGRRHGVTVVLMYFPIGINVSPDEWVKGKMFWGFKADEWIPDDRFGRVLGEFARRQGIRLLDLTEAFRASSRPGNRLFLDFDGHLAVPGHRAAGRALASYLENAGLLPSQGAVAEPEER